MSRSYLLIFLAVALAIAAATVLSTDILNLWPQSSTVPLPSGNATPSNAAVQDSSPEHQMVEKMVQIGASGGVAATFSQKDITLWKIPDGYRLERFSVQGEDYVLARYSSNEPMTTPTSRWEDLGLSVSFSSTFLEKNKGKKIEIGVIARTPNDNASDTLNVVFATQQKGNTGWTAFKLSNTFELHKIVWRVPAQDARYMTRPIVVLHPDPTGQGRSVELLGIYIKPMR